MGRFENGFTRMRKSNDSIFIVVYRFPKITHFIQCMKTHDVINVVVLFFKEVLRLHGLSRIITYGIDNKLLGCIWRTLWMNMWNIFEFNSTYHLHTNGNTKIGNTSLGDLLHMHGWREA